MSNDDLISNTASHVREQLKHDTTGHDWLHTERVWKMTQQLADREHADSTVAQLAALLHDIRDWKIHKKDTGSVDYARNWLASCGADSQILADVCDVIDTVTFWGERTSDSVSSLEAAVVRDADRLDALGAIGIARAFAYGGSVGRPMHDPNIPPRLGMDKQEYRNHVGTTINHFQEKLLLLRDRMQTQTGRRIAKDRHDFMMDFLARFLREAEGRELAEI